MTTQLLSSLIKKEFLLEFRQKSTLAGILVYIVATVFISALCFKKIIHPTVWNALFWTIFMFIAVNVSGKSFMQETKGKGLYNYLYYSPRQFILSKIMYNMLLMAVLSLLTFFFYSWFVGSLVQDLGMFLLTLMFSSSAFSGVLSLMSAIASKANNNISLMAILSFPVLMPLLLVSVKLSKHAIDGLAWSVSYKYLLILVMLNFVVVALATLLFNYLWKE
ncbi:MAG: transporter permease [Bacteroidetes bacterium]|jgi:heme exporter protein B|nr:transporter permease [Bacteroidota bacterium]MDF2453372.1 transporter permease [Bacteroidota bacterium]